MADSAVGVNASSSGSQIDTRTEALNGNHRQVVVLGDPATNAGVAPVDATNGLAVDVKVVAAGENVIGSVVGQTVIFSTSFTRPSNTTAYASGDLVANSTVAGSVTPMTLALARANDKPLMIRRARLQKSTTGVTNASFRAHYYKDSPTISNGDNGAWLTTLSGYLGYVDITMSQSFSSQAIGIGVPNAGSEIITAPSSGTSNIYALLEARAAYTPGSAEVFTLYTEVLRD